MDAFFKQVNNYYIFIKKFNQNMTSTSKLSRLVTHNSQVCDDGQQIHMKKSFSSVGIRIRHPLGSLPIGPHRSSFHRNLHF